MLCLFSGDLVTSNKGIMGKNSDVLGVGEWEKGALPGIRKKGWSPDRKLQRRNAKTENIDQNTTTCCANRPGAWWWMKITREEYEKLGITCVRKIGIHGSRCEYSSPDSPGFYRSKTGMFDPQTVVLFWKIFQPWWATQKQWTEFETALREERIAQNTKM